MKFILFLLFTAHCLLPTVSPAQLDDIDKHFIAGATISIGTSLIAKKLNFSYPEVKGLIVAGSAGLLKEVIDHQYHHMRFRDEPNVIYYDHISDFFYTLSGGMSATLLMAIIYRVIDYFTPPEYLMPKK